VLNATFSNILVHVKPSQSF